MKGQKARNRNDMGMESSSSSNSGCCKKRNLNWLFICVSNKCGGILFPICVHTLCTEIRIKMLVEWYEEKKKWNVTWFLSLYVHFVIEPGCQPACLEHYTSTYSLCYGFVFFSHFASILRLRLSWLPAKNHWKCALTNGIPFLYLQFAILTYTIFFG